MQTIAKMENMKIRIIICFFFILMGLEIGAFYLSKIMLSCGF